jgi:tetratricopeptide (TPR) repeat protein
MNSAQGVRAAVEAAQAGQTDAAWHDFAAFAEQIGEKREVALAFGELLRLDPGYAQALPWAERALRGFATEAHVIIPLAAALLRAAELRPPDEPPFSQGPAHLAAGACQKCFEALPSAQRTAPEIGGYLQLNMADALRMMGPEYDDEALQAYQLALTIDDARGAWWFHLGLLHKWRGRFREGLTANQKAYARFGSQPGANTRPVLWNLAICATALGEGALALQAWAELGIKGELSQAGMPFVPDMPAMQVRVATLGEDSGQHDPLPAAAVTFEVLWVTPFSPCHGAIQTPTARRASVDYGDVVLWDGAPVKVHEIAGAQVPVFPLLWVLRPGDERRLRFVGMQKQPGLVQALAESLREQASLVTLDQRAASDGDGAQLVYGKLIVPAATSLASIRETLERELRSRPNLSFSVPRLYELLGDTPAAGRAHQAWGGIERSAQKRGLLPSSRGR